LPRPFQSVRRLSPLLGCLAVAALLLWWQPSRAISAAVVVLVYLAMSLYCWRGQLPRKAASTDATSALVVTYASQGGQARLYAERSAEQLREAGVNVQLLPLNALEPSRLPARRILFVVSTYGEGEAPDDGARFERRLSTANLQLQDLEYAVLAFGDRQYRHFCAFGQRLDERMRQCGATPLFDRLEADRADPGVLRHWQQQLAHLSGNSDFSDWLPPPYRHWQLTERRCLNPGSAGSPVQHLTLVPVDDQQRWRAGDIVEVGPQHELARMERLLQQLDHDPQQRVDGQRLASQLAGLRLPDLDVLRTLDLPALLALPPLPHREYSIASIPSDGAVQLVVREARHPDGTLGLGSGWLCRHAAIGERIALRIRSNPGFHGPSVDTPLILIGNGTGIAG